MPSNGERAEQHSAHSTNGDDFEVRSLIGRVTDQARSDGDQTLSDSDQTLSDADQTLSDLDQLSTERDQAQSGADQRASDRDQAASDRDRSAHSSDDTEFLRTYADSQAKRAQGTAARSSTTESRALSMLDRAENAAQRDQQAAVRDLHATARDRIADARDRAAEAHERALGRAGGSASRARADAAEDRARAAENRARAAEDRGQAALDRERAAIELQNAQLDDLTGFYRVGLGRAVLQREIDRSRRSGGRLVLAFLDLDGLKRVNDEQGHAAGDALLSGLAEAIRSRLRSYDPVVRVGGDEFVCALSETDLDQAREILRDIQQDLTNGRADASISFGLAALRSDDSLATLLERSDRALREAKPAPRQ